MFEWLNTKETTKTLVDDKLCFKKKCDNNIKGQFWQLGILYFFAAMGFGSNLCSYSCHVELE